MQELECIVTNERDFEELKPYASYFSELTHVMSFEPSVMDKGIKLLDKYFTTEYKNEINKKRSKYVVDFLKEKYRFLLIAPDSYIEFCQGSRGKDSSFGLVKLDNIKYIYILLKYGLVEPTDNFKAYFPDFDTKPVPLELLKSFTQTTKFRKESKWSFEKYYKSQIESGKLRYKDIHVVNSQNSKIFDVKYTKIPDYHELRLVIDDVNKTRGSSKAIAHAFDNPNVRYEIKKYGWAPFHLSIWQPGKEIRVIVTAEYNPSNSEGETQTKSLYNPIVIPDDIKFDSIDMFAKDMASVVNRTFPSNLMNRLFFEYKIRTMNMN